MKKEFILDYSKWRCGGDGKYALGDGGTSLLNYEGFQCCIGQFSSQQGATDDEIIELGHPYETNKVMNGFTKTCKNIY